MRVKIFPLFLLASAFAGATATQQHGQDEDIVTTLWVTEWINVWLNQTRHMHTHRTVSPTKKALTAPKSTPHSGHGVCYFAPTLTQQCVHNSISGKKEVTTTIIIGDIFDTAHEIVLSQGPMRMLNSSRIPITIPPAKGALKDAFRMYYVFDAGKDSKRGQVVFQSNQSCIWSCDEVKECAGCGWMGWMQPELDCATASLDAHRATSMTCSFAC